MASAYPGGLDSFTNPVSTDLTNSVTVPHATQHSDLNDAVEAIQAELGVDPAGASATVVARLDLLATKASPTFTGTVVLPATTSIDAVSATEIAYLDGVTSAIQTQFTGKAPLASPTFTGTVTLPSAVIHTVTSAITASTTQTQGAATALTTEFNAVYNVANDGDAVKLPAAVIGKRITVVSRDVAHTLQVFPATGDYIGSGAVNASVNIAALKGADFICDAATKWQPLFSA